MREEGAAAAPRAWRSRLPEEWARELDVPRLELHARLTSTNDRLRRLALDGAPPFTAVVADTQTGGRGRAGRSWHSAAGSGLWVSVLLDGGTEEAMGPLPLAVGVAVARAIERLSGLPLELKWPNDLLRSGKKVAGILCETAGERDREVIAGIGINLRRPGEGLPTALEPVPGFLEELAECGVAEPELLGAVVRELREWAHPAPREVAGPLRAEWEIRDCLMGRVLAVDGGETGVGRGVAADGALRIERADGTAISLRAGTVRLAGPGPSPALHRGASGNFDERGR